MAKKGKGFFGALGSALGSIPVVGKVKKAAKKKIKKAKKKLKKALKKAKKKLKKKLGKVLTKARKLKNNLSKSKLVKKFKRAVKKAVKKAKKYAKAAVKAVKKAAKTTVNVAKSAAKTTANVAKSAAKTTVNVAKSATKKAAVAVKSVSISQAISTAADFIPGVGNAKAVFETAFGFDPFTLDKLSAMDRGISAAGILGGGYAKAAGKGGKATLNLFSNSKNATNVTESAAKSSKNAASAKSDIPKGTGELKHPVLDNPRVGSALKDDFYHNFNDIIDNYAVDAQRFDLPNKKGHMDSLYQIEGSMVKYETKYVKVKNNAPEMLQTKETIDGVFEWVVDPTTNTVTHRTFIPGGKVSGKINQWGK
ncbi:pre-toxin TG domain-containing protein [Lysinibacillus sp. NPDC056185]|uniref:pre-toxin TG domain-containing protein n=2 Tax=Lysinibacillus TaxID=400634 RepID=UPI0039F12A97